MSDMLKDFVDEMITCLEKQGAAVNGRKDIQYGQSLSLAFAEGDYSLNIYENKKGRITLDTSRIRDEQIKAIISSCAPHSVFAGTSEKEPDRTASMQNEKGSDIPPGKKQPSVFADEYLKPPLIGSDESGKGDYFGGLFAAAVYADEEAAQKLLGAGVCDSKALTDDAMKPIAAEITKICPVSAVFHTPPALFNERYKKEKNINELLSRLHVDAIGACIAKSGCRRVLTDRFSATDRLDRYLERFQLEVFIQTPKAERNVVVAAASILARVAFVDAMQKLSDEFGILFPFGAGNKTDKIGREFVKRFGTDSLAKVAKLNFKNTGRIIDK